MKQVIVVGAGLAGLSAARALMERGVAPVVLEASERVGGRTRTERDKLVDGQHADMGASFIDLGQHRILGLCRELGVVLTPRFSMHSAVPEGHGLGGAILRNRLVLDGQLVSEDVGAAIAAEVAVALDGDPPVGLETMTAWSARVRLSALAAAAFSSLAGLNPQDRPWRAAARYWESAAIGDVVWMLRDGTDSLADRLAEGIDVRLHRPVEAVRVTGSSVVVETNDETFHCDEVVLAVPLKGLQAIGFDPPLPPWKAAAIEAVPISQGAKVAGQYRDGAQLARRIGTGIVSDGPLTYAWPHSVSGSDTVVVLALATDMEDGFIAESDRALAALDELLAIATGEAPRRIAGVSNHWAGEAPYLGAVSMIHGLRRDELAPQLAAPLGLLHFAGEYAADAWGSSMEGAIRSGERAARELAMH